MTAAGETEGRRASWVDLARAAGAGSRDEDRPEELRQLLCFEVDGASYAVPVESVREIVRVRRITPMPRVSEDVCGVIALRGDIVQVVDLRRRMGLPPEVPSRKSRIVVVHLDDGCVAGVLVDSVQEVLRVNADAIGPPAGGESQIVEALCARGDEFVSLIALDRVLQVDVGN